jgi:hypothetical protein
MRRPIYQRTFDSIDPPPKNSNFLVFYHCILAVVLMPIIAKNSTKRASSDALSRPKKRAKGTASQPIPINSQAPALSPSPPPPPPPPITNALQALVSKSQAPTFKARIRESRAEDSIVPPPEGSEHATAAAAEAPEDDEDEDEEVEAFDADLMDKYDGIDWSRLKKYQLPLKSYKYKKSWVYRHGYRVAARSNPSCIHWVCHYCHHHRFVGCGVYHTTSSISAAKRHLEEDKPGHNIFKPGTTPKAKPESTIHNALMAGGKPVLQAVANKLSSFNIHRFRLAAVGWLIENNHPLSTPYTPCQPVSQRRSMGVSSQRLALRHAPVRLS